MICIKAQEFLTLTQGTYFINEYFTKFNHLARYAPKIDNMKIRRMEKFVYKLNLAIAWDVMIRT